MKNNIITNDDVLLALPFEVVELEPEDFEQAAEISHKVTDENLSWKTYLNALALIGFEQWLKERNPDLKVNKNQCSILQPQCIVEINEVCNLKVNNLTVCLINTDDLTEDYVEVTKDALDLSGFTAHFYVLIEVLEEQGQVIIRGFLRYDQLNDYRKSVNLRTLPSGYYQLPLSLFSSKLNKLLLSFDFLASSAISVPGLLPVTSGIPYLEEALVKASQSIVNLSRWLDNIFDTGWEATEAILTPSFRTALAFRFRDAHNRKNDAPENSSSVVKRGKLLNLGVEKAGSSVALIVGFTAAEPPKFQVLVDIYPTDTQTYLPQNLQLMVLDETGQAVMKPQARNNKNISLDFKGNPGEQFSIKVVLGDTSVTETFVI